MLWHQSQSFTGFSPACPFFLPRCRASDRLSSNGTPGIGTDWGQSAVSRLGLARARMGASLTHGATFANRICGRPVPRDLPRQRAEADRADDADREIRLDWLRRTVETYGWRLRAFVPMTNHKHLFVETPELNLSAGIQYVGGNYSSYFNRPARRCDGERKNLPANSTNN